MSQTLAALQITEKVLITRLRQEKFRAKVGIQPQQHRDRVKSERKPQKARVKTRYKVKPQPQPQKPRVKTDTKKENEALDYWAVFDYS